jgi:thioredoxin-related protein
MKKSILLVCIFALFSCHIKDYRRYLSAISTLPSFDMLLTDSVSLLHSQDIPKGKSIMMIYFGPDCSHCQLETRNLISNIEKLKDYRIFFLTMATVGDAKSYAHNFHLDRYPGIITIGKDHKLTFARIFQPTSIPFVAIYNDQKELVKVYHGEVAVNSLLAALHG